MADVNASCTDDGITPLYCAVQNKDTESAKISLRHKADPNATGTNDDPLLYIAAKKGSVVRTELLPENDADVKVTRHEGSTPSDIAAYTGHTEVVRLLLDHKSDVNVVHTRFQRTLLYAAAEERHTEIVKQLLDEKADANARAGNDGDTFLYNAAVGGQVEIVELLPEHNADAKTTSRGHNTPLHAAVSGETEEIVKLLLDNKADVHKPNSNGDTPFKCARLYKLRDIIKLLE